MSSLKLITDFAKGDLKNILDSIDYVYLDIDGVLLHNKTVLPGSRETIEKLRQLGKKIAFVSNNSIYPVKVIIQNLQQFGATEDDIVTPNASLLAYLKKINLKKDIYVISSTLPKQFLKEAGYKVIEYKLIGTAIGCEKTKNKLAGLIPAQVNQNGEKIPHLVVQDITVPRVLLHNKTVLPGSRETIEKLRQLGKKIAFVSNNSIYPVKVIIQNLQQFGATEDDIVTPNASLLAYLKKINLKKDIYVISSTLPKQFLKEAGYKVIEYKDICTHDLEETIDQIEKLALKALEVCRNVGAVYVDYDFNACVGAIQVAKTILNHIDNVLFLSGLTDDTGNINNKMKIIGSKFYIDGLERWTGRKSITMAKPGIGLKHILTSKFNISDDSRVLFVGDNVHTDIAFGVNCGYQTLLVLSGVTTRKQFEEWTFPENFKPTYVSESFGAVYEKIKDL